MALNYIIGALVFVAGLTHSPEVKASPECGRIEDSLSRLNCYDELYRSTSVAAASSVEEAWANFNRLTKADKPGLIAHAGFSECLLYFREFELDVERFAGSAGTISQLIVPLWVVDQAKSGHDDWSGGTKITMLRDQVVDHSTYIATAGFRARFDWNMPLIPPPIRAWQNELSAEMHLRSLYPTDSNGNITFRMESSRSVSWNFSKAWPEDGRDISAAFMNLVRACQSQS